MLVENSYGKDRVRLTKVVRDGERHEVHEYTVEIRLYGEFAPVYTDDDNSPCVPTDTMKNTVYAVARTTAFDSPERFGAALTERLITRFDQVKGVSAAISAERWKRISVDGAPHAHSFIKQHGVRTARVARGIARAARGTGTAGELEVTSGLDGVEIFKSGNSGFTGFATDEYTTLAETDDRILATTVQADWGYSGGALAPDADREYGPVWEHVFATLTDVFAGHASPSLQSTLNLMGERVLETIPQVDWIRFTMPNQHHILFDLSRLGLDNPNEIFYGTDSPFGVISGTIARSAES